MSGRHVVNQQEWTVMIADGSGIVLAPARRRSCARALWLEAIALLVVATALVVGGAIIAERAGADYHAHGRYRVDRIDANHSLLRDTTTGRTYVITDDGLPVEIHEEDTP